VALVLIGIGPTKSPTQILRELSWLFQSEKPPLQNAACAGPLTLWYSGELRRPHHIDLKTGMYRGRQVIDPKNS